MVLPLFSIIEDRSTKGLVAISARYEQPLSEDEGASTEVIIAEAILELIERRIFLAKNIIKEAIELGPSYQYLLSPKSC